MELATILQLGLPIVLFVLAYFTGTHVERSHYRSIHRREAELLRPPAVTMKRLADGRAVASAELVTGNVVVSIDYFKRILASLRALVGGRVAAYETLVDRARREALLRMKQKARDADLIAGVRIETASIGQDAGGENSVGSVEALAYGTAIRFAD